MFTKLALHATTADSVEKLAHVICSITHNATNATRDTFATPEVVDMLRKVAVHATTAESVEQLTSAIFTIRKAATYARIHAVASDEVVDMLFNMLRLDATTAESAELQTSAICTIIRAAVQPTKDLFATPALVGALPLLFQQSKLRHQDLGVVAIDTHEVVDIFLQLAPPCDDSRIRRAADTRDLHCYKSGDAGHNRCVHYGRRARHVVYVVAS